MKRRTRFLLHTLLPPPLGAIVILIAAMTIEPSRTFSCLEWLGMTGIFVIYGYMLATIPSLAYAALMEIGYRCGLTPGRRGAAVVSALLGFLTGSIRFIGEGWALSGKRIMGLGIWPIAGLLTGLIVECVIGWLGRPLTPSSSVPSRTSPLP